jgi:hypothetical protein
MRSPFFNYLCITIDHPSSLVNHTNVLKIPVLNIEQKPGTRGAGHGKAIIKSDAFLHIREGLSTLFFGDNHEYAKGHPTK